ncbi:hypothetical protein IKF02_02635 [Candidatus Saccharibacteria bacterium]|nr:hypothetical protein [Candidatus Saccharibacteria bacterium]
MEKSSTDDLARLDTIGKVDRKEYDKLKRRAIKFESKNAQYVLVIPCDGENDWCEMSDNSALIYKYAVCEKLGIAVSMTDDLDSFYIQYKMGRIRTRGFSVVRRRLEKAGLYEKETLKDRSVIFQLNHQFTNKELALMRQKEEEHQAALNSIVKVTFADPVLHQKMIEVATRLHRICFRRLDKLSSATNGRRIVELCDVLIRDYYRMSETLNAPPEVLLADWKVMRRNTHDLLIELQILAGLKLWTRESCVKVGEQVVFMENRIEGHIKREADRVRKSRRKG